MTMMATKPKGKGIKEKEAEKKWQRRKQKSTELHRSEGTVFAKSVTNYQKLKSFSTHKKCKHETYFSSAFSWNMNTRCKSDIPAEGNLQLQMKRRKENNAFQFPLAGKSPADILFRPHILQNVYFS